MHDHHYPFGNPDGARSNINDLLGEFVSFSDAEFGAGLATRADDLSVRIIVGAKGAGKTVYLRRLQATVAPRDEIYVEPRDRKYVDAIQHDLPSTSEVIRFCQTHPPALAVERWSQLWHCAILRSVVSHILTAPVLREHLSAPLAEKLAEFTGVLHPPFAVPHSVYSQAKSILNDYDTENQFRLYFQHDAWHTLETYVAQAVGGLPPICFFIDAVDDEYTRAPMYWLRCQEGLFERVMRLLRDARIGGRLHLVICVRDHVLADVLKGENACKYQDEPHIRKLAWTRSAIRRLLDEKIERMDPALLMNPEAEGQVARWLGADLICNEQRGVEEELGRYLLRHTRLLPRDLVMLGNALCRQVVVTKQNGESHVPFEDIRSIVADNSQVFGREQLAICASQLAADLMPRAAGQRGFTETYIDVVDYRDGIADKLRQLIQSVGYDHFGGDMLRIAMEQAQDLFDGHKEVFSVLWQNGLIGFVDQSRGGRHLFFSLGNPTEFSIPLGKREYVFHSTLIDAAGIEAVGGSPVEITN
jgi:hypothetical protein